jgi:type III secretory pathway component EscV
MKEITQVVVTAVALAFVLPAAVVLAFSLGAGIPFIATLFLTVILFVVALDRRGEAADAE